MFGNGEGGASEKSRRPPFEAGTFGDASGSRGC
jgi:hypothetical protein